MSDAVGYIRVLIPRYRAAGQIEAMEAHNIRSVVYEGRGQPKSDAVRIVKGDRNGFVRMSGKGRAMAVRHLFLLADPKARGKRGARIEDLWSAIHRIEERGGYLWELNTGRRSNDPQQRDAMIRDAIVALARGRHKRGPSDKRRGRPKKDFSAAEWKQAYDAWRSRKVKTWAAVRAALPRGFTVDRAYEEWGARDDEE